MLKMKVNKVQLGLTPTTSVQAKGNQSKAVISPNGVTD
jgi:hypothetical protein